MELFVILFLGGGGLLLWLFLWSRQRGQIGLIPEALEEQAGAGSRDGVLAVQPGGRLLYANGVLRSWLALEGAELDLEMLARQAEPADAFLGLLIEDGNAAFRLGARWVDGTSHRVPSGAETRIMVVLREIDSAPSEIGVSGGRAQLGGAITIVNEINETINASLGIERVLPALLAIVRKVIPADAGEICLYDAENGILVPRGWDGDTAYVLALAAEGGYYDVGEGISGWIAAYRQPVLVVDSNADAVVRPKLIESPYRSYIAVPLMLGEARFIGTFELASVTPGFYNANHLTLLTTIARPLATAIYNAQLYAAQAQRIEELATLQSEIVQVRAADAETLYATLTERVARLMDSGMCGVLLYDVRRRALVAESPFFGLPTQLVRGYTIPVGEEDSPGRDLWERDFWISNDLADEPNIETLGMLRLINPGGVENTAIMPLLVGGRRIGILQVGNKRTHGGYASLDMQHFRLLAAQAAVAVEEVRLAQEQERRDAEMSGLEELAQSFGELTDETDFLGATNERIARLMNVAACGVLIYDEESSTLRARPPFYGYPDAVIGSYSIYLEPGSPIAQIWQESDWWYTNNANADSVVLSAGLADLALALGIQRTMIVAMNVGGRRLGAIQVSNKYSGDFTDEDARLLLILAAQVGGMIENSRLFRETQRRAEEAERLRVLAELASAILTGEDDLRSILAEVARLLESPAVFVSLLDMQAGALVTQPRYTFGLELVEPLVEDASAPGFERTPAIAREPLISRDVSADSALPANYRAAAAQMGMRAALIVPLAVGDTALGELGVMNRADPPYGDADLALLAQAAIQIAGAFDRIRLYEATGENLRRRLAELDAINRVSSEVAQTLDVDQVLEVIREESVRATDAADCTVVLLAPPETWGSPDMPEISRRLNDAPIRSGLADIERMAALRLTEAVVVDDYELRADLSAPDTHIRSALAAAIIYEDQPVGVIHLYHPQPNHFDSRAATFLLTLSAKASLSYGNLQRYLENQARSDRLRRRVEQLNQIFELGQMLQTGVDSETMLEALAYSIQQSCGFDVVVMTLIDADEGLLHRVAHAGLPIETFERTRTRTMTLAQLETLFGKHEFQISESYFLPFERLSDWFTEGMEALSPHYDGNRTMRPARRGDWRDGDMLLVPITGATGSRLGVISLDRPFENKRPDRGVIEVLEIFAHQAAATLENTRLYTASLKTAEQEARLNEIIESISNTLNPDAIVEAGARGIARLLTFRRLTVALLDTENVGYNLTRVTLQEDGKVTVGLDHRPTLDGTMLGEVYRTGTDTLYLDDSAEFEDLRSLRRLGERTTLVLPLVTGGLVLGAMHIGSDGDDEETFTAFRPLLQRIANLLAVAIQNARLFNQAVNLRLFNESVVQSIQQGIIVMDMDGAILTINEYMRRRFKWDDSALGRKLFEYRPDYVEVLGDALKTVMETGAPQDLFGREVVEYGERLIQNFYLYPLFSADSARGAVLLTEDVTYRATLEANLEQRARQLAALTEVSSRITASLRRDEVIALALDEMARIITYDAMTIWSRQGGSLVCQGGRGAEGIPVPPVGTVMALDDDPHLMALMGTRQAANIDDAAHYPATAIRPPVGSWLAVALIEERSVVGVIALIKREPNFYDTYAEQGAQAFANQVAVALVNAALFEEAQTRTQRLSLLNRVSVSLARSLDTENILEISLKEIADAMGFTRGRAYLIERDLDIARAVVEFPRGDEPPQLYFEVSGSPAFNQIAAYSQPFWIPDVGAVRHDDPFANLAGRLAGLGVRSYLLLPMTVSGQVTGAFELETVESVPENASPDQVDLALIIANQAGIAVMNSNLLEQTLVRTRELETLLEAAQTTSNSLDLDEVFQSVARLVLQALEMDDCAIMLHDNVLQTLIVQIDLNRSGDSEREMSPGTVFDLRHYPAKLRAINDGQIIIVRADDANADPAEIADMARSGESARMLVPLIVRDQVIGLLQIEMQSKFRSLTHREVRMAQALGAQAASSIENARLSTETAAQVEHSLVMNELSRAVSSTMDISDMLRIVRDQVPPMLDADTLYVALYNQDTEDIVFPMAVTEGRDIFIPPRVLGRDEVSFIIRNRRPLSLGGDNPSADQVRSNLRIENGEGEALRYLGVPLIAGDQIVGVLAIRDSRVSRPFGLNDQRILSTIGTQLSAAIQNAHLFERVRTFADELNLRVEERTKELQSERDRLDALFRITVELGSTLDMDRLLRGALENVARVIGADDGVVLLVNPLTDRLYTRSKLTPADGEPPTIIELDGEHPFHPAEMLGNWLMLQTMDRAYVADDLVMQGYWDISAPGADAYRSALAVMLETQEDAQGAMIFLGRDSGQFTEDQLKLVQTAALQVSTAINNAELYSLIRDQAERMGTLLRVEQEEAGKNSAILEGIADGVMLVDASEVIVLFNNAAERILDLPRDYALGQQLNRLTAASPDAEQWVGALRDWIGRHGQHGDGASIEDTSLVIDRLDVGQRIVSIRASAVYVGSELLGTVAVLRDVTKEVEVDRMKSEFIANVTHELRTPLTSIVGYIDLMMMGGAGNLGEQPMRFLSTIKTNADRLRNLVEDLLSISELDSGRGKLNLEPLDLADAITGVARSVDESFAARGKTMRLVTEIAADIGTIQADKVKFGQIIANILENAYHYTYADGVVTVRAARERDGAHVLISIADTGIGIPEAFRERIWNRFERYEEHALVMDVAGTGLGLPIVKTLVELHNGRVWFETEVNRGTTFYVRLPVEPGQTRVSDPLARLAAPVLAESDAAPTNGHAAHIEQTQPLEEG